ncbi:MAG TPA: bifunctional pyr operon transcriptional regulator/uracil phosphoribosyltransferase, partial [Desulfovibrio sp.]|nr:bifunctional pyr operon transcriptional regulator/uracil phosphoribosyltransferase [Desulfovibrio sp.]
EIPFDIESASIVLVDDVLFSGRTVRAALEAVLDFGRPRRVELLVLVDRGHRELPIRADYVGKEVVTFEDQHVNVLVKERDDEDKVVLIRS